MVELLLQSQQGWRTGLFSHYLRGGKMVGLQGMCESMAFIASLEIQPMPACLLTPNFFKD